MMKFLITFAVLLIVVPAFGQRRGASPEQMRERMIQGIDKTIAALELNDAEAEKVRPVLEAEMEKRIEMMAGQGRSRGNRGAMREKMDALKTETETALAEVLSAEQLESYKKFVAEQGGRQQRGRRGQNGGRRGGN